MRVGQHLIICFSIASLAFFSCSARYDVAVGKDGTAQIDLQASLGARTSALIANLSNSPSADKTPLPDALSVSRALKASTGVSAVSLKNPDQRSLSGTVAVSRFDRFLSPRFIRVEKAGSGGRATVSLDRENVPEVLASLSPEIGDYLSALMAPAVTGDKIGGEEYLSLVASVYGEGVAREIRSAKVAVSLRFPGTAVSARGGTVSGDRAEFSLSMLDFLTLEKPISLEAVWK